MLSRRTLLLGIAFFLLFNCKKMKAQDFEIAPVKLEFNSEPGENQNKTVTVKNHSNKKESFIIVIGDFLPTSSGDITYMAPNSVKRSCANWLNINPSFFELNPGDEIPVQISMMVPNDQYSSAWCIVYFQSSHEQSSWSVDKNLGAGVSVTGRIGISIHQSPKSNTNHSLKISNLVETTKLGDKNRVFTATIENLGDKITKSKTFLIASNMQTAEEKQFNPVELEIFPKMSRTVNLVLPNELASGTYSLAAMLDYGPKYALEGTQIIIEVKDQSNISKPESTIVK